MTDHPSTLSVELAPDHAVTLAADLAGATRLRHIRRLCPFIFIFGPPALTIMRMSLLVPISLIGETALFLVMIGSSTLPFFLPRIPEGRDRHFAAGMSSDDHMPISNSFVVCLHAQILSILLSSPWRCKTLQQLRCACIPLMHRSHSRHALPGFPEIGCVFC